MISMDTGSQKTVGGQAGMATVISRLGTLNVESMIHGNLKMMMIYIAI